MDGHTGTHRDGDIDMGILVEIACRCGPSRRRPCRKCRCSHETILRKGERRRRTDNDRKEDIPAGKCKSFSIASHSYLRSPIFESFIYGDNSITNVECFC
jgi:hypothetical protein